MIARNPTVTPAPVTDRATEVDLPSLPRISLHGTAIDLVDEAGSVDYVAAHLHRGRGGWVITANLDHLRRAATDEEYAAMLRDADLVVADGMPLVWASRLQGTPLPERVAGSNLISSLSLAAGRDRRSIYLLGGVPGSAEGAAQVLIARCPGLEIAGIDCPPLGFEHDAEAMDAIVRQLQAAQPDIVYVALGSPKQERLIRELRSVLPCAWWVGVGISFSFLTGDVQRAPRWMQRLGLEWVHRLVQEPRRLASRYLRDGLPYAARLLGHSLLARRRSVRPG